MATGGLVLESFIGVGSGMTRETIEAKPPHNVSEKKRTTVTTIETHEIWVVRGTVPEAASELGMFTPPETAQSVTASTLSEANNSSENKSGEDS